MCRTRTFKYTGCGHSYTTLLSHCGGTKTHTSKNGKERVSCIPTKGSTSKQGLVVHFPKRCPCCTKEAVIDDSQRKVDAVKAKYQGCPLKAARQIALKAELEHEGMCLTMDQRMNLKAPVARKDIKLASPQRRNLKAPVARKDIKLASPQRRKRAIGGSPLKEVMMFDAPDTSSDPLEISKTAAAPSGRLKFKLTLRPRPHCKKLHGKCIAMDCERCKAMAGVLAPETKDAAACNPQ